MEMSSPPSPPDLTVIFALTQGQNVAKKAAAPFYLVARKIINYKPGFEVLKPAQFGGYDKVRPSRGGM